MAVSARELDESRKGRSAKSGSDSSLRLPSLTGHRKDTARDFELAVTKGQKLTKREVVSLRRSEKELTYLQDEKLGALTWVVGDMHKTFDEITAARLAFHRMMEERHANVLHSIAETRELVKKKFLQLHQQLKEFEKRFTRDRENVREEIVDAIARQKGVLEENLEEVRGRSDALGKGIEDERDERNRWMEEKAAPIQARALELEEALQTEIQECARGHEDLRLRLRTGIEELKERLRKEVADRQSQAVTMHQDWRVSMDSLFVEQDQRDDELLRAIGRLKKMLAEVQADRSKCQTRIVNNLVQFLDEFEGNIRVNVAKQRQERERDLAAREAREKAERAAERKKAKQLEETLEIDR